MLWAITLQISFRGCTTEKKEKIKVGKLWRLFTPNLKKTSITGLSVLRGEAPWGVGRALAPGLDGGYKDVCFVMFTVPSISVLYTSPYVLSIS